MITLELRRFLLTLVIAGLMVGAFLIPPMLVQAATPPLTFIGIDGQVLNSSLPYLVNGEAAKTGTLGVGGCTAFFDSSTGTLTLHGYNGGCIGASGILGDLAIKLVGSNTITDTFYGISNTGAGDISITADSPACLQINASSYSLTRGITTQTEGILGAITIGGKADVQLDIRTTATGPSSDATGLYCLAGAAIEDSASLKIYCQSNAAAGRAYGIYTISSPVTINTAGKIEIDCSSAENPENSYGILAHGGIELTRAERLELKWPAGGYPYSSTLTYNPTKFAVIDDRVNRVATYRWGYPCDLKVINGFIDRGFHPNDITTGQFLEDDEIEIYARGDIINYEFDHWSDTEYGVPYVYFIKGTTVNSARASFFMSPEEANLQANYRSTLIAVQPLFDRASSKVTWTLTAAVDGGQLHKKSGDSWIYSKSFYGDIWGEVAVSNTPGMQPDGIYRLAFIDNSGTPGYQTHYSEEFVIDWTVPAVPVTGVTLDQTAVSFDLGETAVLTATVLPANATNKKVWWSSSDSDVVAVNGEGLLTAVGAGTASVEAKTDDGDFTANCQVTVTDNTGPVTVPVTGVTLDQTAISLNVGETAMLTATVLPANATNKHVAWHSDNHYIAQALLQEDGRCEVRAIDLGTTTIHVSTVDGGFSASCQVTVTAVPVTGVTLDQTAISLNVGETAMLTATVLPANATDKNVSWHSDNNYIAQTLLQEDGRCEVRANSPGTTAIHVSTVDGGFSASCQVTVIGSYEVTVINGSGSGIYNSGATVQIGAADPPAGQVFHLWTGPESVTFADAKAAHTSFVMPHQNITVTATYRDITYKVTVQNDGHGAGQAAPTTAAPGTRVALSAAPNPGYRFKEWQVLSGGITIAKNVFIMPDHDVTVKAIFEEILAFDSGDLTGDGVIDVQDAIRLLKYIAGTLELAPAQQAAADVNGDGKVNIVDAVLILRYSAGLINVFPLSP